MSGALAGRLALLSRQAGRLSANGADTRAGTVSPADAPANPLATAPAPPLRSMPDALAAAALPARTDLHAPAQSFAERMHRIEARAAAFARPTDEALAGRLGGRLLAPGLIEIEHRHPLGMAHGHRALDALAAPCLDWLTGPRPAGCPHGELVFIDTETTGLAGGTGTIAFLVGIARVRGPVLVVTQWLITCFSAERAMLEALIGALRPPATAADAAPAELVSYNGKSFDVPLLATRLKLARMQAALAGHPHHDLLHPLRTAFARRWPDCRLQTAERLLLGIAREDDLPGHRIPAVWADFVQFGEARELDALVRHNRIDLLSLAALLPALGHVYLEPGKPASAPDGPVPQPAPDSAAISRMQRRRRRPDYARAHLLAGQAALDARALHELADLHRARSDWDLAVPIWKTLAGQGSIEALAALAKYHEHVARDLGQALRWCEALCRAAPADAAHRRRLQRLERRIRQQETRAGVLFA
ncbi:MAG: ribonuclease H-like domain-containing protein [Betaproteobacteria bacterium]|nr:ribonuclease H-like domain-containing protein [Betaproteobacteria bacterium]